MAKTSVIYLTQTVKYISKLCRFIKYSMNDFILIEKKNNNITYSKHDNTIQIRISYKQNIVDGSNKNVFVINITTHNDHNVSGILNYESTTSRQLYKSFIKYIDNCSPHIFSKLFD